MHFLLIVIASPSIFSETQITASSFDTLTGWGNCGLPEDAPLTYSLETGTENVHEGVGSVRLTFDITRGPVGMKYFTLPNVSGSDGFAFWMKGDGSGAEINIRLSQSDWSAWDTPSITVNFNDWKRIVFLSTECNFHNWGGHGANWNTLAIFAPMVSGVSCSLVIDDLRFYSGTADIKDNTPPDSPPITLKVNMNQTLPAIPSTLKGVDFALVNWNSCWDGCLNTNAVTLFNQSGAKIVRFWPFCPGLKVSTAPNVYNWTTVDSPHTSFDQQMAIIQASGADVIMTCNNTPLWLSSNGDYNGIPNNWSAYEKLIYDTVMHCKTMGWNIKYWEVWNEPDLSGFLSGTLSDLCEIYTHFCFAVSSADPSVYIGGPAASNPNTLD